MTLSLVIDSLHVGYRLADGSVREVVRDVSLSVQPGDVLGIVGESGCGKSTLAMASVGWLGSAGVRLGGHVRLGSVDLYGLSESARRSLWGRQIVYLPQDAGSALHPTKRIGALFDEVLDTHTELSSEERHRRTLQVLSSMRIDTPETSIRRYPHQFSGGQRQRIALALALVAQPSILVLDEPTTGSDATTQDEIIRQLRKLLQDQDIGVVYISHDIALLCSLATRLAVMYAGEIVEEGPTAAIAAHPRHPYTIGLIDSVPRLESESVVGIPGIPPGRTVSDGCAFAPRCSRSDATCTSGPVPRVRFPDTRVVRCHHLQIPTSAMSSSGGPTSGHILGVNSQQFPRLKVEGLTCEYSIQSGQTIRAVDEVTIDVLPGESVGIVGESGSGKSTLLAAIAGLIAPRSGVVELEGENLPPRPRQRTLEQRAAIQIVFQDPHTSLNPRHTVEQILINALRRLRPELNRTRYKDEVARLLQLVRLRESLTTRYPGQLSGGEKQRVALARALSGNPKVLLCDEVVSALDVSVQAAVLNLLLDIRREIGTSIVLVGHDIAAVRLVADRLYVMKEGRIIESGEADEVVSHPKDGYTQKLVASIPRMPQRLEFLEEHQSSAIGEIS